jgi:hypothetical protein
MFHRFRYEAAFYPGLSRIPLHVRMKLDVTGLKISLKDWLAWSLEERAALCHLPIESEEERRIFASYIDFLCRRHRNKPAETTEPLDGSGWEARAVPPEVAQKSAACLNTVTLAQWQSWKPHQRYALFKTAVSKSQPEAFADILDELRGGN